MLNHLKVKAKRLHEYMRLLPGNLASYIKRLPIRILRPRRHTNPTRLGVQPRHPLLNRELAQACITTYTTLFNSMYWQDIFIALVSVFWLKSIFYPCIAVFVRSLCCILLMVIHNYAISNPKKAVTFYELFSFVNYLRVPGWRLVNIDTFFGHIYLFILCNWAGVCLCFYYSLYLALRWFLIVVRFRPRKGCLTALWRSKGLKSLCTHTVYVHVAASVITYVLGLHPLLRLYAIYQSVPADKNSPWTLKTRKVLSYALYDYIRPKILNRRVWFIKGKGIVCNGLAGSISGWFGKICTPSRKYVKPVSHLGGSLRKVGKNSHFILIRPSSTRGTIQCPGLINKANGKVQCITVVLGNPSVKGEGFFQSLSQVSADEKLRIEAMSAGILNPDQNPINLFGDADTQSFVL